MSDIGRYAHPHTFPNGNVHRHVHEHGADHPDEVYAAHPDAATMRSLCVDCEPWRAQAEAIKAAESEVSGG